MGAQWEPLARALAANLDPVGGLDAQWRRAFAQTPRHRFVPQYLDMTDGGKVVDGRDPTQRTRWLERVYSDSNLVTQVRASGPDGTGARRPTSSSSMPQIMAWMLQALDVADGHRVLEIGTGTGYNTALLAQRLGDRNVVSIDIDPELVDHARERLRELGHTPTLVAGDGAAGVPEAAPFNAILATAAVDHIPAAWIEQLRPGGVIVTDLRGSFSGAMARLRKTDDDTVEGRLHGLDAAFMPMRQDLRYPLRHGPATPLVLDRRHPLRSTTGTDVRLVTQVRALRLMVELQLGATRQDLFVSGDEVVIVGADGSWAAAAIPTDASGRHAVQQGGPRRLWDCAEAAVTTWQATGHPPIEAFGATATTAKGEQRVWLREPSSSTSWPLPE